MRSSTRKHLAGLVLVSIAALAACSDDDPSGPPVVNPPLGLQVTPTGATSIDVRFTSTAGDNAYHVERAEGAQGTFAEIAQITAPAASQALTHADTGLKQTTLYRYRVKAVRGSTQSEFTSEQSATTQPFGASFTKEVTGDITTNTTWDSDTTYLLKGYIHVANGATLTIQPGTVVKGDYNTLGSSLFVLRGGKINAVGRADAPIVFTSSQPAGQRKAGDWGGLIMVGNATLNRTGVELELEGTGEAAGTTPGTNYSVKYHGGTTDTDNSGELKYVRVEFAGYAPAPNEELNSFTFAALGSGTKLSFLQVLAGLDDSYEFFGGTADATNLVSYDSGDDHFDMSEGYRGRLQYLIALQTRSYQPTDIRPNAGGASSDPQGIENDGCEGAGCQQGRNSTPLTTPVVANFTLVGTGNTATSGTSGGVGVMIRRGVGGWYVNGIVARWPRAAISLRDGETYVRAGSTATPDLATADLGVRNLLLVENGAVFQTGGTSTQNALNETANALVSAQNTAASLFTAFPATVDNTTTAAAFDWTPPSQSGGTNGGMAAFAGKLATAASTVVAGTAFRGAANPAGPKWWQGWTSYARN